MRRDLVFIVGLWAVATMVGWAQARLAVVLVVDSQRGIRSGSYGDALVDLRNGGAFSSKPGLRQEIEVLDFSRPANLNYLRAWGLPRRGAPYIALGELNSKGGVKGLIWRSQVGSPQEAVAVLREKLTGQKVARSSTPAIRQDASGPAEPLQAAMDFCDKGHIKYDQHDYPGALADYNRATELAPKFSPAYNGRGFVKQGIKDYPGALADYNRAIELDPKDPLPLQNRGGIKAEMGNYSDALADLNRCIELDPQSAKAFNDRGVVKERLRDYSGALGDYNRAIELDPQYSNAYSARGTIKYYLYDFSGALSDYDRALELDPQNSVARTNRNTILAHPLKSP